MIGNSVLNNTIDTPCLNRAVNTFLYVKLENTKSVLVNNTLDFSLFIE